MTAAGQGPRDLAFLTDEELAAKEKITMRREAPSTLRAAHVFGGHSKFPVAFHAFKGGDPYGKSFPFHVPKSGGQHPAQGPAALRRSPKAKPLSPLLTAQISTLVTLEPLSLSGPAQQPQSR
jgi:hypothetical protein